MEDIKKNEGIIQTGGSISAKNLAVGSNASISESGFDTSEKQKLASSGKAGDRLDALINSFKDEHKNTETVFVMMKFSGNDEIKNLKLQTLFNTIKLELYNFNLIPLRAGEKDYSETKYLWDNVLIYMNGCDYGIAILENFYEDVVNPNVAMEYGYMLAKNKSILLLKEESFDKLHADILGTLWNSFDINNMETVKKVLQQWMVDMNKTRVRK